MREGKLPVEEDSEDTAVMRIAMETAKLIESRRKKEQARKLARMLKNYQKRAMEENIFEQVIVPDTNFELELEESELEKLRKLQEMQEEIAAGLLLTHQPSSGNSSSKYEAPLITQLRSVETVEELYRLADKIVQLPNVVESN